MEKCAVTVFERLRDPNRNLSRSSAERTAPPRSAHVQLDEDLRLLDPARGSGEVDEFFGSATAMVVELFRQGFA